MTNSQASEEKQPLVFSLSTLCAGEAISIREVVYRGSDATDYLAQVATPEEYEAPISDGVRAMQGARPAGDMHKA